MTSATPTLLYIDDDPALIPKQVRLAFPAPEHTVEVARSGAAGLDRIRASAPDVVAVHSDRRRARATSRRSSADSSSMPDVADESACARSAIAVDS